MTPQSDLDSSSSEEFYQAIHHAEQTFRKMESYLKQQQLCDVILIVGNRKIPAHRLVLSSVSDYFAAMFTSDVYKLFVIGGRDGLKTLNTVECYNPKTKTWTVLPPMSTHRHGLGVTVLEGPIYAVGGHDGWSYLNTVERWDPQSQQWTFVASMSIARSTVGVAALNGK
uniref:Kelch like family member 1 n=1 Tax=Prolemur simus TaxID=1328070 RepID=A0A8C8YQQ9_PROSS